MRTKTYPSDISRAQFAHILPLLETEPPRILRRH